VWTVKASLALRRDGSASLAFICGLSMGICWLIYNIGVVGVGVYSGRVDGDGWAVGVILAYIVPKAPIAAGGSCMNTTGIRQLE
jgi:hypothetical protein